MAPAQSRPFRTASAALVVIGNLLVVATPVVASFATYLLVHGLTTTTTERHAR